MPSRLTTRPPAPKRLRSEQSMQDNNTICPLKYLTHVLGGKWKIPIICILADPQPQRYSSIKRRLGNITNMMLAQSLKELESSGMVSRTQFNEIPPHVEYSLTDRGRKTLPFLTAAAQWATQELSELGMSPNCENCSHSH